jgi:hypothetical protein
MMLLTNWLVFMLATCSQPCCLQINCNLTSSSCQWSRLTLSWLALARPLLPNLDQVRPATMKSSWVIKLGFRNYEGLSPSHWKLTNSHLGTGGSCLNHCEFHKTDNSVFPTDSCAWTSDVLMPLDLLVPLEMEELCLELLWKQPIVVTVGKNVSGASSSSSGSSSWHQNEAKFAQIKSADQWWC